MAVEGDVVNYTCRIEYYGNTAPSISWYRYPGINSEHPYSRVDINDGVDVEQSFLSVQAGAFIIIEIANDAI